MSCVTDSTICSEGRSCCVEGLFPVSGRPWWYVRFVIGDTTLSIGLSLIELCKVSIQDSLLTLLNSLDSYNGDTRQVVSSRYGDRFRLTLAESRDDPQASVQASGLEKEPPGASYAVVQVRGSFAVVHRLSLRD